MSANFAGVTEKSGGISKSGTTHVAAGVHARPRDLPSGLLSCLGGVDARAYAFLSTNAEFFDPNAMQLQTACAIIFFIPATGT